MPSRSSSSHAASRLSLTLGRQTAALPIAYSYLGEPSEPLMAGWGPLAGPLKEKAVVPVAPASRVCSCKGCFCCPVDGGPNLPDR